MEEYIGACLIIKTTTGTHIGRLQQIEPEKNQMVVEISGMLKTIELTEIDEVELLAEEDSKILQNASTPQKIKQKDEEKKIKLRSYLTKEDYNKVIDLSDMIYGPSRGEIIYSGARGVLHLFVNIFRLMDKKFVVYTGAGVFSEIGVVLARLCLLYGMDVSLVLSAKTQRIAKELFYYESNNGVMAARRNGQPIVIIADVEVKEEMVAGAERVIFLGDYKNIPVQNKEVIFFGMPLKDPLEFTGNAILCDIGLSPKALSKFNIKKYAPKLLQKIAKQ